MAPDPGCSIPITAWLIASEGFTFCAAHFTDHLVGLAIGLQEV